MSDTDDDHLGKYREFVEKHQQISGTIRKAAKVLGDLSKDATDGRWAAGHHPGGWWVEYEATDEHGPFVGSVADLASINAGPNARWIATMSPAVAGPLVQWLNDAAGTVEVLTKRGDRVAEAFYATALDFARAILGTEG